MIIDNTGLVVSLIALIPTIAAAMKEKWYVKRSSVQRNGITLIIVGLISMVSNPNLLIYKIPIGVLLIGYGILAITLINSHWDIAQKLGNSRLTVIFLIINALAQYGVISLT